MGLLTFVYLVENACDVKSNVYNHLECDLLVVTRHFNVSQLQTFLSAINIYS